MAINDNTSYELFGYQVKDLATKIKSKAEASSLAPVATSGLYSDLTGKPFIPAVYNGTLTIQQNGITLGTFTANQSTNTTISIDTFYPVGSIYMSATLATAAAVEAALGGTWVAWGAGRVPVGVDASDTDFDTVEETGGEKTHTLTVAEMPSHYHTVRGNLKNQGSGTQFRELGNESSTNSGRTETTGGDGAHNNLQPYITCYMYKRTA